MHDTTSEPSLAPRLRVTSLSCRRGNEWLFRNLSFDIWPGQLVWLRGPNGSGKTSLLRALVGLSQPDGGRLAWLDGELYAVSGDKPRVVYIGHLNALKDDLTVCEALQFVAGLHGNEDGRTAAVHALRHLAMHHRRNAPVRTLSQGQRRRVALARLALEKKSSLWVLDEPFDALDTAGIEVVNQLLRAHLHGGGCVLLTSHLALSLPGLKVIELTLESGISP